MKLVLKRFFLMMGLAMLSAGAAAPLQAEEKENGVLAGGVVHNIASDRKVEKIGGILQPEPLDLYLKRLFLELSQQMTRIENRLENIEKNMPALKAAPEPQPKS